MKEQELRSEVSQLMPVDRCYGNPDEWCDDCKKSLDSILQLILAGKGFAMTDTKRSDLREKLVIIMYNASDEHDNKTVGQAADEIMKLFYSHIEAVVNEVIGEDDYHGDRVNGYQRKTVDFIRNKLRAEQRQRLAKYLKGDE